MSYVLGGKRFETTTAVSDYARIILHRALPGFALEGEDAAFVADLFSLHPDAGRKAGVGIEFFYVGGISAWGTRNFLVYRSDSSVDNFSIKKCVASLTRTPEAVSPSSPLGQRHQTLHERNLK